MKEIQIIGCKGNFWYKQKKFPVKALVEESVVEKDSDSYNTFFSLHNSKDFYYSPELMGFIAKEDCIDIKTAESYIYDYVNENMFEKVRPNIIETLKFDNNKPDFTLIPQLSLLEVAKVFTHGNSKYGCYNYSLGTRHTRYVAAAQRHINQWLIGEDIDTDSQIHHLAAVAANALMALDNILTSKGVDNRNKVYNK